MSQPPVSRLDALVEGFSRRLMQTPMIAAAIALLLLVGALGLALQNERLGRIEKAHQAAVQADILAGTVAAPLAFEDADATREYVAALKANPDIQAAAAYDAQGRLAAAFTRQGPPPPATNTVGAPTFSGNTLSVTAKVTQNGTAMGSVYLRTSTETLARRVVRYTGIGLLVVMASLLVAVLGAAYAQLARAHRTLTEETAAREAAEAALRQSQKMEAMGQLTGGVAHDFNNLLMVASSGLDLMQRTSDPARRERLMAGIRQAIDRGAGLTQQLLAFARRSPLNPEVVDIGRRLAGMHALLDRSLREDIFVDVQMAPGLWPVEVDPSQLEVAVLNIALNARDAMPNGGTIVIRGENVPGGEAGPDRVRLSFTDSGVGIPPEAIPRLFEPFFTTKDVGQGTGLGLSQVYGFTRSSGGEVDVRSKVGEGTTISLLLPRTAKPPPVQAAPREAAAPPEGARRRLLVVEDDDAVAELVTEMLDELGYESFRAPTAAKALDALDHNGFDLVFSDMVMPGEMGGLDLAREIARRRPDLPIILTTGYSSAAASAMAEGLRLLVKPYRIDALAAELKEALPH
jgi:signal transduction histidine kinase